MLSDESLSREYNVKRLTLKQKARVSLKKKKTRKKSRLVQIFPFPKYPVLHVHLNDPLVSVHTALALHVCVPLAHSSMSGKKYQNIYIYLCMLNLR